MSMTHGGSSLAFRAGLSEQQRLLIVNINQISTPERLSGTPPTALCQLDQEDVMNALIVVMCLAAAGPCPDGSLSLNHVQPSFAAPAPDSSETVAFRRQALERQSQFFSTTLHHQHRTSSLERIVPYHEEIRDLYHRYRADRRWHDGIGITFTLGRQRHRWTFAVGPVQFTAGGHAPPADP